MKFSHVRPTSSVGKQRVSLKELIATFLVFVSLAGSNAACIFNWDILTDSYNDSIKELRNNLPTDYNLTVYLQSSTGMDSCCLDLQALLSLNRSLGHLHRNSVAPLQSLVITVIKEIQFIAECPVNESSDCQVTQWNSTHLLETLQGNLQSFAAKHTSQECNFSKCLLHTCSPGQVEPMLTTAAGSTVTTVGQLGHFTGGADQIPTTTAVPTSPNLVTDPPSPSGCTPPNSLTDGNHLPPASSSGNNPDPSAVNGSATDLANSTDATPSTTTDALNNASTVGNGSLATGHGPDPSSANASLTNGTKGSQVNISQTGGDDQSQANSTSPNLGAGEQVLASIDCRTEEVSTPRSRMVTVVMVVSVLANAILLGCLLRKRRRQAAAQMTEMEPLSSVGVEQCSDRRWSRR